MTLLANRAHWARTYLSKAGLLESPRRNVHVITDRGRAALEAHPERIDNAVLSGFADFEAWRATATAEPVDEAGRPAPPASSETPEDQIAALARAMDDLLATEVIEAVLALSPARFERLIVDLLLKMGYGGGNAQMGKSIGRSGDGGIDGIITEDALGLDAVYIQAKRYALDNKVGRPALNAFVGSLTGEGASKGVFVTTSDFSREAVDYVARVQHRIVLVNGTQLARLMIRHEVGVRARKTYVLRSVDEDYFSDV
jgi:restriction system protein